MRTFDLNALLNKSLSNCYYVSSCNLSLWLFTLMVTIAKRVARVKVIRPQQVSPKEINSNSMLYFQSGMLMTKAEMQDHNLSVSRY